jgi:small conductance mechanosensitive channel
MDINVDALWSWVSAYALNIIGALLIFIVGKWLARRISNLLSKLLEKNNFDLALVSFLKHLT